MATVELDTTGFRCPQPVIMIAAKLPEMQDGDILAVRGDCPTLSRSDRVDGPCRHHAPQTGVTQHD